MILLCVILCGYVDQFVNIWFKLYIWPPVIRFFLSWFPEYGYGMQNRVTGRLSFTIISNTAIKTTNRRMDFGMSSFSVYLFPQCCLQFVLQSFGFISLSFEEYFLFSKFIVKLFVLYLIFLNEITRKKLLVIGLLIKWER